jgi:hypothetical protein
VDGAVALGMSWFWSVMVVLLMELKESLRRGSSAGPLERRGVFVMR